MKTNRSKVYLSLVSVVMLAALSLACSSDKNERQKLENGNIVPIKVATVTAKPVTSTLKASGLLFTDNEARMAFKIGGVIDKIAVEEGDKVRKGQVLATLNGSEINSQYEQAKLAREKAQRDHERAMRLYKDSVVTLEQMENARTAWEVATKTEEMVAFNRQYAEIRAKSDGFVARKLANEGEVVGVGSPILVISENSPSSGWVLRVGVSDKEWVNLAVGQKAQVTLDAFPGVEFQGEVVRKSQAADQGTGSFQAEIGIAFTDQTPALGMFGKAAIFSKGEQQMPVIPFEAMMEANGKKAYVMVPTSAQSVKKVQVTIHSFNGKEVFISSGLQPGDKVVISNAPFLNERSVVKVL